MLTLANDDIICEHGKFSPETVPKLKRLKKVILQFYILLAELPN